MSRDENVAIYCVLEGFDMIYHGDISKRRNFGKYHQNIADISVGGDKSSIFFINWLSQKKSPIFLQFIVDFLVIYIYIFFWGGGGGTPSLYPKLPTLVTCPSAQAPPSPVKSPITCRGSILRFAHI